MSVKWIVLIIHVTVQTQSGLVGGITFLALLVVIFIITTIVFQVLWLLSLKKISDLKKQIEPDNGKPVDDKMKDIEVYRG